MRAYEKDILKITDFEQAAQDPAIQQKLKNDSAFKTSFEAQRALQSLARSASISVPEDVKTRIRAGTLRQIRSIDASAPQTSSVWQSVWAWKYVWGTALVLLMVVPAFFNQEGSLSPVTDFTYQPTPEPVKVEVAVDAVPMQIISNNLQTAPIEVTPVEYKIP